jgi:alkylation response protein AidB-like acyl-CoA dehydrogenase
MWTYTPPLRDMRFVFEEVLDAPALWRDIPSFSDLDMATAAGILEEAGKFAADILLPTNSRGDLEGCRLEADGVHTPTGFREAYRAFVDAGWPALACAAESGGQGLPQLLNTALYEMLVSANHAWAMYPGLLHGAYESVKAHGDAALRERYLPKLVSGEWLAAMALTEPQAGTDLGLIRTQAQPAADGSLRVTGGKIFISGGDHDLTDNIVHLVLCRLAGAPAGTRGLSLVLVPKVLPDGTRNAMRCAGLEKKMGIKGSATCVMQYEGATGWLIGEPHRGLSAMFIMMNAARLHVGVQGLGHLEMAAQNARSYASERVQMRAPVRPGNEAPRTADPIEWHPSVRRKLFALGANAQGARILSYWTAHLLDAAEHHPDAAQRGRAQGMVALLTPIVKGFVTDLGHHGANSALQVWGGYGFIHDYNIEQTVRDSRIAMIYEGTNEVQAVDLLMRKVLEDGGARFGELLAVLEEEVQLSGRSEMLQPNARALQEQIETARQATNALLGGRGADPEWPLRIADDYMQAMGYTLLTWAWTRTLRAASAHSSSAWHAQRAATARYGIEWLTPHAAFHWQRVLAREAALPWMDRQD